MNGIIPFSMAPFQYRLENPLKKYPLKFHKLFRIPVQYRPLRTSRPGPRPAGSRPSLQCRPSGARLHQTGKVPYGCFGAIVYLGRGNPKGCSSKKDVQPLRLDVFFMAALCRCLAGTMHYDNPFRFLNRTSASAEATSLSVSSSVEAMATIRPSTSRCSSPLAAMPTTSLTLSPFQSMPSG